MRAPPDDVLPDGTGVTVCMHVGDFECHHGVDGRPASRADRDSGRAWVALGNPCVSVYVPSLPAAGDRGRRRVVPDVPARPAVTLAIGGGRVRAVESGGDVPATVPGRARSGRGGTCGTRPTRSGPTWRGLAGFGARAGPTVAAPSTGWPPRGSAGPLSAAGRRWIRPGVTTTTDTAPIPLDDPSGVERILVVTAHPDDVDFGVAGSVATWVKAGDRGVLLHRHRRRRRGFGPDHRPGAEMAAIRRQEQRAAAAEVGVTDVTFLGYPDGRLVPSIELRRDISRQVRIHRPERLVCQSPDRMWDRIGASHPDHLAAGEAAVCAAYPDARNPFAHPELLEEGLEPHAVAEIWMMAAPGPNRVVDVTDTFDRKIAALLRHRSQVGDGEGLDDRLRDGPAGGRRPAWPPALAESFQVVVIP